MEPAIWYRDELRKLQQLNLKLVDRLEKVVKSYKDLQAENTRLKNIINQPTKTGLVKRACFDLAVYKEKYEGEK